MSVARPGVVQLEPVTTVIVCPACSMPIQVGLGLPGIDSDGLLVVDDGPVDQAMRLHLIHGCPRVRRATEG